MAKTIDRRRHRNDDVLAKKKVLINKTSVLKMFKCFDWPYADSTSTYSNHVCAMTSAKRATLIHHLISTICSFGIFGIEKKRVFVCHSTLLATNFS